MEIGHSTVYLHKAEDWVDVFLLGDFHEGNYNHDHEALDASIKIIKQNAEKNPYTFVILMGDYCEYIVSQSDPRWDPVVVSDKYKIKDLKNLAYKQTDMLFERIEPIKHHVVALLVGNHEESFIKHNASDVYDYLTKKFPDATKLGYVGYYVFDVEYQNSTMRTIFALNHGEGGGGKTLGYQENKLYDLFHMEKSAAYRIAGHMHRLITRDVLMRDPDQLLQRVNRERIWYGCSGCYLRTYKVGHKNYFEKKGREEADIGMLKASFRYYHRQKDGRRFWVKQHLLKKIQFDLNDGSWEEK